MANAASKSLLDLLAAFSFLHLPPAGLALAAMRPRPAQRAAGAKKKANQILQLNDLLKRVRNCKLSTVLMMPSPLKSRKALYVSALLKALRRVRLSTVLRT